MTTTIDNLFELGLLTLAEKIVYAVNSKDATLKTKITETPLGCAAYAVLDEDATIDDILNHEDFLHSFLYFILILHVTHEEISKTHLDNYTTFINKHSVSVNYIASIAPIDVNCLDLFPNGGCFHRIVYTSNQWEIANRVEFICKTASVMTKLHKLYNNPKYPNLKVTKFDCVTPIRIDPTTRLGITA